MRGKSYREGATLRLPVYLDDPLQARLSAIANANGVELYALVNDLLPKDLELIEMAELGDTSWQRMIVARAST